MKYQAFGLLLAASGLSNARPSTVQVKECSSNSSDSSPSVDIKNGTVLGTYSPEYKQDYFLGVPFAQPPVGNLRFDKPQSLNTSFPDGQLQATEYSDECVGYGGDQLIYTTNEDCLYLNIVRPAGYENQSLPVAFWIHGGGFVMGGAPDKRYNLSYIVENSVQIGSPIVAVSTNYRLSAWGFLASNELAGRGLTNLGLRDQRKALEWVQENIEAFGGDPSKVTIFGESAGAGSVGFHLTAFGGRDDKLFRGAIMQSGNPVPYAALDGVETAQPQYNRLLNATSCNGTLDTLQCLRNAPFETLNNYFNGSSFRFQPILDGDYIKTYGSQALRDGNFIKVPIIDGANSDEGSSFAPRGLNTTEDIARALSQYPQEVIDRLLELYPDDLSVNVIASLGDQRPAAYPFGTALRRAASIYGDNVFIAARRYTCEVWAANNIPAYCYRFNAIPNLEPTVLGVAHFQEVAYVFNNILGTGYGPPGTAPIPLEGKPQSHIDLSSLMTRSWISFVAHQDPNAWEARPAEVGQWPQYDLENPQDFVFDANVTSYAEPDTYRAEGIRYMIDNFQGVFRR